MRIFIFVIIILALLGVCRVEPYYTDQKICNAIFIIEGGYNAYQLYGINPKYVICGDKNSCFDVCVKTVHKWRMVYNLREQYHYPDFLTFLAHKYCPYNWQIWLKNLKYFLKHS